MTKAKLQEYVKALNEAHGNENRSYEIASIGRTYAKIVMISYGSRSAWGFIAMTTPKGKEHIHEGDLLKSASWKAPATNRARGNILKGTDMTEWTGPTYLNSHGNYTPHGQLYVGLIAKPSVERSLFSI